MLLRIVYLLPCEVMCENLVSCLEILSVLSETDIRIPYVMLINASVLSFAYWTAAYFEAGMQVLGLIVDHLAKFTTHFI